jgi:hypothetical protein
MNLKQQFFRTKFAGVEFAHFCLRYYKNVLFTRQNRGKVFLMTLQATESKRNFNSAKGSASSAGKVRNIIY